MIPTTLESVHAGAVTVDWVVLTAAVVGLAIAAYSSIQTGATGLTTTTSTSMGALTDPNATTTGTGTP